MIIAAESSKLAASELAARPQDAAALEMVRLTVRVLENLGEIAREGVEAERSRTADEVVHALELKQMYEQGVADCKARRCRLGVVDGGRAVPGPR